MNELEITDATVADAAALVAIYTPYVLNTAITFEYEGPTVEEFARRIADITREYPYLVARIGGKVCGYCYAHAFNRRAAYHWAVETSIYVATDERGHHVGRALYEAMQQRLSRQGILNMYACITWKDADDEYVTHASPAFHARLGFKKVAHFHKCGYKFGRWYDVIWMEKFIGRHQD